MNGKYKVILVGTGGFGLAWCRDILPSGIKDGRIKVVAAVDINSDHLQYAKEHLGLSDGQCYLNIYKAFDENKADVCAVVVPPEFHESVVDVALAHDCHILSEKPIADTLDGAVRIAKKVESAGKKMGVTMSHRFDEDKTTLRRLLQEKRYGALDYLAFRFTCALRKFADWGKFRHEMLDPMMIEGGIHHLDYLTDMTGSKCDTIYAQTWNPSWGEYAGDSEGHALLHMQNDTRILFEDAKCTATTLNNWTKVYIRAECEKGTIILDRRKIVVYEYDDPDTPKEIPLLQRAKWTHYWMLEQFCDWLDGGEPMLTNVDDNLQSVALVFSAIESSRTGEPIKVQEFLQSAVDRVVV